MRRIAHEQSPEVLHVFKSFYPDTFGGIEEMIAQLCRLRFREYGARSTVFTLSPNAIPQSLEEPAYTVIRCKQAFRIASTPVGSRSVSTFRRLAQTADVIHYHYPWPIADLCHILTRPSARAVITYHSDIYRQRLMEILYRPLRYAFFSRTHRIVATSPQYLNSSPVLRRYRDKTITIPIGIEDRSTQTAPRLVVDKWQRLVGKDFLLYLGGLRYYKGLHVLLAAMTGISGTLVIAGKGEEDTRLRRLVEQYKLRNVIFAKDIDDDDKNALFRLCRVFILPSLYRTEAFGIVLAEASMFGVPMISTELGTGTSYVNLHDHTGLVVPPGDVIALRTALKRLLGDIDLCRRFGRNARRRYEMLFTGGAMVAAYEREYRLLSLKTEC